ncbi:acetylxylan esterase [uncultured Jatrophihabitans sp.]|uniref:acetylxylan esterase n=1 Tax=uncultured Jatrophihabitans sp. TaxID=1610747 RepID=UPI0035CC1756
MAHTDLSLAELGSYRSSVKAPSDVECFWQRTLDEARSFTRPVDLRRVPTGLSLIDTFDVVFSGFGGHPIRAWYHRPTTAGSDPIGVVVRFQGYGGGRGLAHQVSHYVLAGYACLEMDTRGQGAGWGPGDTPDPVGSAPSHPGFLTRGILDPNDYYYRRVFTDAVRAVETVRELPGIDPRRVVVAGMSQGGGICLAVTGLVDGIAAAMPDVPFLCDFPRAAAIAGGPPYSEIAAYLSVHPNHIGAAFDTLAYFDATVLSRSAVAPALFSVALMDQTCPPSTVYGAYHSYGGPKEMRTYPFNDHEGGHVWHEAEQLRWLLDLVPPAPR